MTTSLATSTNFDASLRDVWMRLSPSQRQTILNDLTEEEAEYLITRWGLFAHPHQWPPHDAQGGAAWTTWLLMGGRGAGKTRAGAEWIRAQALGLAPLAAAPVERIALIGETDHDVREVMIEGVSGLLAVHHRSERPTWIPTRKRLEWPNGAVAQAFSADDPESLRGPQFGAAWADELAKWRYAQAAFDMLQFGLRLGASPRQMITTTPRPTALIKRLIADPQVAVTHAPTRANAFHLSPAFLSQVMQRYRGTRLGRQELDGEIVDDRADALWTREMIERVRVMRAPELMRIVVAVDPPVSIGARADACGIVVAGRAANGHFYVLDDCSIAGLSPAGWATKAVAAYRRYQADSLVAEVNQGGEMVRSVIAQVDASLAVQAVRATRGKYLRAEPVAMLYAQGRVFHAGGFAALEDEMCDFSCEGLPGGASPDRLDALVWALTALMGEVAHQPRVRHL